MPWKLLLFGMPAFLFICGPVVAQSIPVLSGKYATTYNQICQAGTNANNSAGAIYNQILVVDFNKTTKTVSLTGTSVYGALTAVNGAPARLAQTSVNASFPYSNTATATHHRQRYLQRPVRPLNLGNASVVGVRRDKRRRLFRIGCRDPAIAAFCYDPGPVAERYRSRVQRLSRLAEHANLARGAPILWGAQPLADPGRCLRTSGPGHVIRNCPENAKPIHGAVREKTAAIQ